MRLVTGEMKAKVIPMEPVPSQMDCLIEKMVSLNKALEKLYTDKPKDNLILTKQTEILDILRKISDNQRKSLSCNMVIQRNEEGLITGITINPEEK
jgi:hypothetical protein